MQKGGGLVYSWVTSQKVRFEFHGEPDVTPEGGGATTLKVTTSTIRMEKPRAMERS